MIDWEFLLKGLPYVLSLLATIFAAARWASSKAFVTRDDFSALSKKVEAQGHELGLIRKDIEHLPDGDQFAELSEAVVKLTATTEGMEQRIGRIDTGVTRIEDYLLKGRS